MEQKIGWVMLYRYFGFVYCLNKFNFKYCNVLLVFYNE